jgi:hypothetical protein
MFYLFLSQLNSNYFFYSSECEEEPSNKTANIRKYSIVFIVYQAQQAVAKHLKASQGSFGWDSFAEKHPDTVILCQRAHLDSVGIVIPFCNLYYLVILVKVKNGFSK